MIHTNLDSIMESLDLSKNPLFKQYSFRLVKNSLDIIDKSNCSSNNNNKKDRVVINITEDCPNNDHIGADYFVISKYINYNPFVTVISDYLNSEFSDIFRPVRKFS